jgi:YfiH family protein
LKIETLSSENLKPISHYFFTRKGGSSSGIYAGLNCGFGSSDSPLLVERNRCSSCNTIGIDRDQLVTVNQTHSSNVVTLSKKIEKKDSLINADAMVTNKPNIGLGILTADCQPVFFADPHSRIIGAAHAGWKGTLSGILEATIGSMIKLGATRENIHAVIGPSISQKAYEVGSEFVELFIKKSIENKKFFKSQKNGKFLFDLNGISLERLVKAGVKAESVNRCTYSEPESFYSYRRSFHRNETDYGRLLSVIIL